MTDREKTAQEARDKLLLATAKAIMDLGWGRLSDKISHELYSTYIAMVEQKKSEVISPIPPSTSVTPLARRIFREDD